VDPDTLPPPAVTDEVRPPAEDAEVFGGRSPGLRWTVLQLLFGPDDEDVFPSELAELDELELSACAAMATTETSAIAQIIPFFMRSS